MTFKIDLTWGESVCVRQAFVDTLGHFESEIDTYTLMGFGYPKHEGNDHVVELTREVIERQTGLSPKYVFLTNGATGGVVIALRSYFQHGFKYCLTDAPPYFPLYPDMIKNSGLIHLNQDFHRAGAAGKVLLLDSPANPSGMVTQCVKSADSEVEIVWDAVYHNKVYMPAGGKVPDHDIMVGSYSKLLGVNGFRVGWVATNDDELAKTLTKVITAEYIGLSAPTTHLLLDILPSFDWETFEQKSQQAILRNKEEWSKVMKYLGGGVLPINGMFHYAPIDTSAKLLLEKAGVMYMCGSKCGAANTHGRFNLGQDNALIRQAVTAILKADVIFKL